MKNITKGKWNIVETPEYLNPKASCHEIHSDNSAGWICKVQSNGFITKEIGEANAELIADAGTTANKCGLFPSELLEQRDELLQALTRCKEIIRDSQFPQIAIDAIEKATKQIKQ